MKKILACIIAALFLSGCGLFYKEPYRKVNYYDLDCKAAVKEALNIRVAEVSAVRPYTEKMVFRISSNRLEVDEFNRWADAPSALVRKYFTLSFQNRAPDLPVLEMKAEILQFEADLVKPSVKIVMQVAVTGKGVALSRIYSQEVQLEKVTGESFARGAEAALAKIVDVMAKDISGK